MKTLKAALLIILGSFVLATGFAFAGANNQLNNDPFSVGSRTAGDVQPSIKAADVPPVSAPAAVTPAPKPTFGQKVTKFIGDNKTSLFMGALGAFVGYALIGTIAGACTFGVGAIVILAIAAM